MMRPTMCNSVARHRFNPDVPTTFCPSYLDGSRGPEYATRAEAEADFNANPNGAQAMHDVIEDESGEAFGIYYDQVQADYHRLFDLGVLVGTHIALWDSMVISREDKQDVLDELWRVREEYTPETFEGPYNAGYHAAYANTMTPEILACFEVKA